MHLPPDNPSSWAKLRFERLFAIDRVEREEAQLGALQFRFGQLRNSVTALRRLADKQGVATVNSLGDALSVFFDHRVYKSYPLQLIETRNFRKLTAWLDRLTTHDLTTMDLSGLKTVDDWLDRLNDFGMIMGHSTGTTGKLSFIPRSQSEWPAWQAAYNEASRAATGVDPTKEFITTFFPGYRSGHQMALKLFSLFTMPAAGGPEHYHTLYQTRVSADLLALAGRMQASEDRGELDRLSLDPELLAAREEMIAQARRRERDVEEWFTRLIEQFRGQRVKISGPYSDLVRVALAGRAKGLKCAFTPDSIILSGGGMKGFKDAPADWEDLVKDFFGIHRFCSVYGMSEIMTTAPQCEHGYYHFLPHVIPILLDKDAQALPRTGIQTGRLAVFDLLAETYWGGFISGDKVTMHWDEDCACSWKSPRIAKTIARFAEMEGGDDKITCAGSAQAYNEFMDYVANV
jgi:hypothetical protein